MNQSATTVNKNRPAAANGSPLRISGQFVNILSILLGATAAYFMTIQSLKVELAAKAESAVVGALDTRLGAFEVYLKEGVVTKEQFYNFATDIDHRLTRIENLLEHQSGASRDHR